MITLLYHGNAIHLLESVSVNIGGTILKKQKDCVKTPSYMRASNVDSNKEKDLSVGDVLRSARKSLIARQIAIFFFFLLLVLCIIAFFAFGYFEQVFDYFADRLL